MVALGEMWRNLSPEEKLVYNKQAKLAFQVKKKISPEKDDITLPDKRKNPEGKDNLSQESEEEKDSLSQDSEEEEDNVGEANKQKVESESDSNEEISDSSEDPEDVN